MEQDLKGDTRALIASSLFQTLTVENNYKK